MFNLPFLKKNYKLRPVVLLVLDGFGVAPPSDGNAIAKAKKPYYDYLVRTFPNTTLIASGESVGLPANEVGNTEVGHLTLGAGRVILQDLKRINLSIEKGRFYENLSLLRLSDFVRKNNSSLHILGLVGTGNVHSSIEHLYALLQFAKKEGLSKVFIHAFTDGRDSPPNEGSQVIASLEEHISLMRIGKIASITGRYYAMDRDRRWDRTERAYKAVVQGIGRFANNPQEAIKASYEKGVTDEFVEPTVIVDGSNPVGVINDGDGVVFFNYRIDRPKQLSMALTMPNFESIKSYDFGYIPRSNKKVGEVNVDNTFNREKKLNNIYFVTMTEYDKNLPVSAVAFPPEIIEKPLSEVIKDATLTQLHMSESEKERFVKYYFNGLREDKFEGESDVIVPSPKVPTYDKKPEMAVAELVSEFKRQLDSDKYSFAIINFANPDMVAHSGNVAATIKAIEAVDKQLKVLVETVLTHQGVVFITADHGNAEELITYPNISFYITSDKGTLNTDHSNNLVPFIVISNSLFRAKINLSQGALSDVAPTILSIMGLPQPSVMTGKNLLIEVK